mmetsp:Transcript_53741/g.98736  ORF Transcript_53741/g.98736 Transcript_53741/m.98736 type:complete len:213 (+) Transcript_53741:447-1085(+)
MAQSVPPEEEHLDHQHEEIYPRVTQLAACGAYGGGARAPASPAWSRGCGADVCSSHPLPSGCRCVAFGAPCRMSAAEPAIDPWSVTAPWQASLAGCQRLGSVLPKTVVPGSSFASSPCGAARGSGFPISSAAVSCCRFPDRPPSAPAENALPKTPLGPSNPTHAWNASPTQWARSRVPLDASPPRPRLLEVDWKWWLQAEQNLRLPSEACRH